MSPIDKLKIAGSMLPRLAAAIVDNHCSELEKQRCKFIKSGSERKLLALTLLRTEC